MDQIKMTLTDTVEKLAAFNVHNRNYLSYFEAGVNMNAVAKDFELLLEFKKAYQCSYTEKPHLGDSILLPDGQTVYFCSLYNEKGQTCSGGSFHLSNWGTISFSGGLDSGISYCDIFLTEKTSVLPIWFCHQGYLKGGCAIYANIECRVWETKPGAALNGIPQVKSLRRWKLKEQSEKVIKIDGNNQSYTEYLPEIIIMKENLPDGLIEEIKEFTGLAIEEDYYYYPAYWCQPMTLVQINRLRQFPQFKIREDRGLFTYNQILVFEAKKYL